MEFRFQGFLFNSEIIELYLLVNHELDLHFSSTDLFALLINYGEFVKKIIENHKNNSIRHFIILIDFPGSQKITKIFSQWFS